MKNDVCFTCTVCRGALRSAITPLRVQWVPEWNSGHPEIDAQRRLLIEMANEYFTVALNPQAKSDGAVSLLTNLLRELATHFDFEERILEQVGYPKIEEHRLIHCELLRKAETLNESYQSGEVKLSSFVFFLVDDVVVGHMLQEDQLYYPLTREKFGSQHLI